MTHEREIPGHVAVLLTALVVFLVGGVVTDTMDGRGCALDNVFLERLWRTVKYENIYLVDYTSVPELEDGLHAYFQFYNHERLHQSLGYHRPAEGHCA